MEAPPVNKLLQLLRQKSPEPPDQSPVAQDASRRAKRHLSPDPNSSIQHATVNGTQTATNGLQYAIIGVKEVPSGGTQCATQSGAQPATNSIQPATDRSMPDVLLSSTQYATESDVSLVIPDLSKGQRRVLQFLIANRNPSAPSRTVPVGYHAISTYCFLSRNGSRNTCLKSGPPSPSFGINRPAWRRATSCPRESRESLPRPAAKPSFRSPNRRPGARCPSG